MPKKEPSEEGPALPTTDADSLKKGTQSTPPSTQEPEAAAPVLVHARTITAQAFVQTVGKSSDPIGKAFLSCEHRAHGVRKLSESEWKNIYSAFLSAPR